MRAFWAVMFSMGSACFVEPPEPTDREGDEPGECSDGADNDADGAFDCDDSDCAGSPDCDTGDDTGGDDTGGDASDDTGQADDTALVDDTGPADTGQADDTGGPPDAARLKAVAWNCDDLGYFGYFEYAGRSGSGDLWITQTVSSAWSEVHTFTPSTVDPAGEDSEYYYELDTVDDFNDIVSGRTTLFDCDLHSDTLLMQFDLWNETDSEIVDCALFGDVTDPAGGGNGTIHGSGWSGDCSNVW